MSNSAPSKPIVRGALLLCGLLLVGLLAYFGLFAGDSSDLERSGKQPRSSQRSSERDQAKKRSSLPENGQDRATKQAGTPENAADIQANEANPESASETKPESKPKGGLKPIREMFDRVCSKGDYQRSGAELTSLGMGAYLYKTKHRKWPATLDALSEMSDDTFNTLDPWGNAYEVRLIDGAFEVRSAGADEIMDTADDIYWRSNAKPPLYNPLEDEESEINQQQED